MDRELLIYGGLILMAIIIVVTLVKKAVKLAVTLIGVLVVFSLIRVFVYGASPIDELNAYKTNIQYGRDIAQYTGKIKASTDIIRGIIEEKKYDEASLKKISEENEKLHHYQKEVKELKHTEKLDSFHASYCSYLNTIVVTTESTAKIASVGDKTVKQTEDLVNKLKIGLDNLSALQIK